MEAGSSEEPPPPKPRRAGSFHPKSVRIRDDSLEDSARISLYRQWLEEEADASKQPLVQQALGASLQ